MKIYYPKLKKLIYLNSTMSASQMDFPFTRDQIILFNLYYLLYFSKPIHSSETLMKISWEIFQRKFGKIWKVLSLALLWSHSLFTLSLREFLNLKLFSLLQATGNKGAKILKKKFTWRVQFHQNWMKRD